MLYYCAYRTETSNDFSSFYQNTGKGFSSGFVLDAYIAELPFMLD